MTNFKSLQGGSFTNLTLMVALFLVLPKSHWESRTEVESQILTEHITSYPTVLLSQNESKFGSRFIFKKLLLPFSSNSHCFGISRNPPLQVIYHATFSELINKYNFNYKYLLCRIVVIISVKLKASIFHKQHLSTKRGLTE